MATIWPRLGSKYYRLCFRMTTEVDLLEAAAATLLFSAESSLSIDEMIAQASYDIIKVAPKMKIRSSDLYP